MPAGPGCYAHAKTEEVSLHLRFTHQECWLTIHDDGVGFDPTKVQRTGGLGLRGIRKRVAQMGGILLLESTPEGGGTTLQLMVKLQRAGAVPLTAGQPGLPRRALAPADVCA